MTMSQNGFAVFCCLFSAEHAYDQEYLYLDDGTIPSVMGFLNSSIEILNNGDLLFNEIDGYLLCMGLGKMSFSVGAEGLSLGEFLASGDVDAAKLADFCEGLLFFYEAVWSPRKDERIIVEGFRLFFDNMTLYGGLRWLDRLENAYQTFRGSEFSFKRLVVHTPFEKAFLTTMRAK